MKIVLTGSLGHIGLPLAKNLVEKSHPTTIISSTSERKQAIEDLGAVPAFGSLSDAAFLSSVFTGADIVYLMEPPVNFFDASINMEEHWLSIAKAYTTAVRKSGVKKIIHLSSIGAHTDKGNGMLSLHHAVETLLNELPDDVIIKFMRPVGFYYNMFAFIPAIKKAGAIFQNYGGNEKEPWVAPEDIAAVITEEIESAFDKRMIRYIASDEQSPNEVATILGAAIGNPGLKWITIPDEEFEKNLLAAGMQPAAAKGLTAMNAGRRNGILYKDYYEHKPALGNKKLTDFAKEFAIIYNQ